MFFYVKIKQSYLFLLSAYTDGVGLIMHVLEIGTYTSFVYGL